MSDIPILICGSGRNKNAFWGINPYPTTDVKEETSIAWTISIWETVASGIQSYLKGGIDEMG